MIAYLLLQTKINNSLKTFHEMMSIVSSDDVELVASRLKMMLDVLSARDEDGGKEALAEAGIII